MNLSRFKIKIGFLLFLALLILFEIGLFFVKVPIPFEANLFETNLSSGGKVLLKEYANKILEVCSSAKHRPSCYDEEIPKLMDEISMLEAFEVTRFVQERDDSYWYCHVLGHNLSARETAKDPSSWKDVIARSPLGICSNGAIHGAFQERFRVERLSDDEIVELTPDLGDICEPRANWEPTAMQQATCYHALGHLTMYITGADVYKASGICDEVTVKDDGRDYSRLCYDGVFMQIYQPLEPEDFALIEGKQPTREEHEVFCKQFDAKKASSCWREGWPLHFADVKTPEGLVEFCSVPRDESERDTCYLSMFYVLTALHLEFGEDKIVSFCSALPSDRMAQCFANAASRLIETDASLAESSARLCAIADARGLGEQCYRELLFYSTYNFPFGSEEFLHLCNSLPSSWASMCLKGERSI